MHSRILLFLLFFFGLKSQADNSLFVTRWNEIQKGKYCSDVTISDFALHKDRCRLIPPGESTYKKAGKAFENFVFQRAADLEIRKNKCDLEKIKTITGNGRLRKEWSAMLVQTWLMNKRARLFLERCQSHFYSKPESFDKKGLGLKKAYEAAVEKEITRYPERATRIRVAEAEYKDDCFDQKTVDAMRNAEVISKNSLPGISSSELFKIVDKHQGLIINKYTGKPLSDKDILDSDLEVLDFLDFKNTRNLFRDIDKYTKSLISEKTNLNKQLSDSFHDLPQSLKDVLQKNGTMSEVLYMEDLVEDEFKNPNPGAACLAARYDPNYIAEAVEFIGLSLIGGAGIKMALSAPKLVNTYRAAKFVHNHAFTTSTAMLSTARLFNKCLSPSVARPGNQSKGAEELSSLIQGRLGLSRIMSYRKWSLDYLPEEIPSCEDARIKDSMVTADNQKACMIGEVANVTPFKVGVPVIIGTSI